MKASTPLNHFYSCAQTSTEKHLDQWPREELQWTSAGPWLTSMTAQALFHNIQWQVRVLDEARFYLVIFIFVKYHSGNKKASISRIFKRESEAVRVVKRHIACVFWKRNPALKKALYFISHILNARQIKACSSLSLLLTANPVWLWQCSRLAKVLYQIDIFHTKQISTL